MQQLSVIICTYNPNLPVLQTVLDGLKDQSLDRSVWELLIIDNKSTKSFDKLIDLSWHPFARIIREENAGLAHARIAGVHNSTASLLVFVDDDNLLDAAYLEQSLAFFEKNPQVGCFGGKSLPVFETTPPAWFEATGINLGCQNFGDELYISDYASADYMLNSYPEKAPIGTGMVISKKAFLAYLLDAQTNPIRMMLGRNGESLSSGEDNDIILSVVKSGYEIAYVPELVVHHLISKKRYTATYLQRMAYESNRTWVKVQALHKIGKGRKIEKWSYGLRKVKSYLSHKAWKSPAATIKWYGSCGTFKGLTEI